MAFEWVKTMIIHKHDDTVNPLSRESRVADVWTMLQDTGRKSTTDQEALIPLIGMPSQHYQFQSSDPREIHPFVKSSSNVPHDAETSDEVVMFCTGLRSVVVLSGVLPPDPRFGQWPLIFVSDLYCQVLLAKIATSERS